VPCLSGDQNVESADRLSSSAQGTGGRDLLYSRRARQVLDYLLRSAIGFVEVEASGNAAIIFNAFEDLLLVLFAHARQSANLAFAREFLYASEVADLKCVPDQRDGLRPESLNLQQLQH